jgi:hypothetical protein
LIAAVPAGSLQSLRLAFKRAFAAYFLELDSPGIADPTEAFEAALAYLAVLREQLGYAEFMHRLDDDTTHLAGQVEQDLRHRFAGREHRPAYEDLEDRLRECFEYGLSQLPRGD